MDNDFSTESFKAMAVEVRRLEFVSLKQALDAGNQVVEYLSKTKALDDNGLADLALAEDYCSLCETLFDISILLSNIGNARRFLENIELHAGRYNLPLYKIASLRLSAALALSNGLTDDAKQYAEAALLLAENTTPRPIAELIKLRIIEGDAHSDAGNYSDALASFYIADNLLSEPQYFDLSLHCKLLTNIGTTHFRLQDADSALRCYRAALKCRQDLGDVVGAARLLGNILMVFISLNDIARVEAILPELYETYANADDKHSAAITHINIGAFFLKNARFDLALRSLKSALDSLNELSDSFNASICHFYLAQICSDSEWRHCSIGAALEHISISRSLVEDAENRLHYIAHVEKVWSEICEKAGDAISALRHYQTYHNYEKRIFVEHRERVMRELQVKHESDIAERERAVTDRLLHTILPSVIVPRMKNGERIAESFESASIMFADAENFSILSQTVSPEQIIEILDDVFSIFDEAVKRYGCEKIKTIGDAYMAVAGAPIALDNHAERMAAAVLCIRADLKKYTPRLNVAARLLPLRFRFGLHTGPIVAGVIGKERYLYDIFGDAVNTAARMESSGITDKIQCTKEFAQHLIRRGSGEIALAEDRTFVRNDNCELPKKFYFCERGDVNVKSIGIVKTFFLEYAE